MCVKILKFHVFQRIYITITITITFIHFIHLARTFFLVHTTLISQTFFYAFFPNRERHFPNLYMPLSIYMNLTVWGLFERNNCWMQDGQAEIPPCLISSFFPSSFFIFFFLLPSFLSSFLLSFLPSFLPEALSAHSVALSAPS